MGMDTLINGPKHNNGHRRGDFALVLTFLLSALEIWRSISPAQAATDTALIEKVDRIDQQMQGINVRLSVAESKLRK